MSSFGARIRELRVAAGLSQQALAGKGLSAGYVSLIESDKRTPSPAAIQLIAERLGVPVEQLLDGPPLPPGTHPEPDHARLEVNFARLALGNGNPAEAVRCLGAVDLERLDSQTAAEASLVLAESLQQTGQLDRAVAVLESLIARCRTDRSWITLAVTATTLAVMYIESGDIARSVDTSQQAMQEVQAAGLEGTDEHLRLGSVLVSGLVERGDLVYATRHIEDLMAVADRVGSARARGSVYWNAGAVAHERGRVQEAIRLTDRAVALLGEETQSRDLPRLRMHYAWLLINNETPYAADALDQLARAEADTALAGSRLDLGLAAALRGRAHLLLGDVDDAAEQAARALQLLGSSEHTDRVSALLLLGDVGAAQLDMELAEESYAEAERVLAKMTESRGIARLWRELGDSWKDFGEPHRAIAAYDRAFRIVGLAPRPKASRSRLSSLRGTSYAPR